MKKNTNTDKKKIAIISGLSALCIAVLAGAYFLTREPERDFTPVSTESANVTDTWEENSNTDTPLPSATPESTQTTGTPSDNTQAVVSEDEMGTTSSLSDSSTKDEAGQEKPDTPPKQMMTLLIPTISRNMNPPYRNPLKNRRPPLSQAHPQAETIRMTATPDRFTIRYSDGLMWGIPSRTILTATVTSTSRSARWAAIK